MMLHARPRKGKTTMALPFLVVYFLIVARTGVGVGLEQNNDRAITSDWLQMKIWELWWTAQNGLAPHIPILTHLYTTLLNKLYKKSKQLQSKTDRSSSY